MNNEEKVNMVSTYELLLKVLSDDLGFIVLKDEQDDFSISDYVGDSLTFIQLIISIENAIGQALPDDFLDFEILSSAKGFSEKLASFLEASRIDSLSK